MIWTRVTVVVLLTLPAFAGSSLVLTPGVTSTSANAPNMAAKQAWRVEFQMHDWAVPANPTNLWDMNDIGATAGLLPTNVLRISDKRDTPSLLCDLPLAGYRDVLVRVQRDPIAMRFVCELWSFDGSGHNLAAFPLSSFLDWPYSGGTFGGQYTTARLGFYRVFSTILPDNSQPPVTAALGDLTDLKFDGNTLDDSGNQHNLAIAGVIYANTPDQNPAAVIKTGRAPMWSNWVSLRAGYPAVLDGTASFSLADASSAVTYQWQQLSGPTSLKWSDQTAAKPTVEGTIFGDYRFRLQVVDVSGKTATTDLEVGAVATDDNGVVVNANPAADLIFGPMIAFGRNPWQWEDYLTVHSASLRKPVLDGISPPPWINNLSGTITYSPYWPGTLNQTTLCAPVQDGAATSITVCDITRLAGITYPAIIQLASSANGAMEEVIVDSAFGNVLHVPYNGRGFHNAQYGHVAAPQAWPSGTLVNMQSTTGTGTHFLADFCPAGIGEEGQIVYSAGAVGVTAGSPVLTGTSTAWDGSLVGFRVRIQGTHSGLPFVFFATVSSVNNRTSISMDQPWPSDADSSPTGLSYAIIRGGRYLVRRYTRPDGSTGMQQDPVSACMSDTLMYQSGSDNIPVALGTCTSSVGCETQSGKTYSYSDYVWTSEFGINYYDEVLAHYAGYFRSGLNLFRDNARKVGDYWPTMPLMDEGYVNNAPRDTALTGVVAAAVLDNVPGHDTSKNWNTIRRLATFAIPVVTASDCNNYLREEAYQLSWVALAAMFDPDPGQKANWQSVLNGAYTRDSGCLVNGNTFYNASPQGTQGTFTMSHGSPSLTGSGFVKTLCPAAGAGTINSIRPGDTSITGTGFVSQPAGKIVISAIRGGVPYRFYSAFTYNSPTNITLTTPFDGDAGFSYTHVIEADQLLLSFSNVMAPTYNTDVNTMYTCTYNDSSHITLDRGWEGSSGTYYANRDIPGNVGYGNNPFQVGIKTLAMRYAALGASGSTAANYAVMNQAVSNWILSDGFDPVTKGMYYLRGFYNCEPPGIFKPGCSYGPGSETPARQLNGEAQNAMSVAYLASPTGHNRDFGDQFYGGQWGKPGFGPYGSFPLPWADSVYLSVFNDDSSFNYKWIGFLFGIGMGHQWPAVRLGGVQPANPVSTPVPVAFSGVPGAVRAQITVTQPSSATTTYSCTSSPCQVIVDQRQGTHWYQIAYLDANNTVVFQGQPALLNALTTGPNAPYNGSPIVYVDSMASGAAVIGTVTISGWAIDNTTAIGAGIATVQVTVDGIVVGNATYGSPRPDVCAAYQGRPGCPNVGFTYQLDTTSLSAGTHTLGVVALDTTTIPFTGSYSWTVTVTAPPLPAVYIDSLVSGATVTGTATISGWAIDGITGIGAPINNVLIEVDGAPVGLAVYGIPRPDVCAAYPGRPGCPNVGFTYLLNALFLSPGLHTITVIVTDTYKVSNSGSYSIQVVVKPLPPPKTYIDSLASGATISGTVTVSGWAIDNVTAINGVQVLVDGTAVGIATYGIARPDVCGVYPGSPGCPNVGFTFQLNTASFSVGTHTLAVVATDQDAAPDSASHSIPVVVTRT